VKQCYSDEELAIARLAVELDALAVGGSLSAAEAALARASADAPLTTPMIAVTAKAIRAGMDPLGERLVEGRTQDRRRELGAFYTSPGIVAGMLDWVAGEAPSEIVDCGSGTGRFALVASKLCPKARIVAIEIDPLACLITRANAAVLDRSNVIVRNEDFTTAALPAIAEKRAFVGNPPYVRHHLLTAEQKARARKAADALGVTYSGLSGLHAHFIVAAASLARDGDVLCFITSAEWLDVNYGRGVRELMTDGLRAEEIHLLDASIEAFSDAASTAVIICARSGGDAEDVRLRTASSVRSLLRLSTGGRLVSRSELQLAPTWGKIVRNRYVDAGSPDSIPLGSIARVHRGAVTGANEFFVMTRELARHRGLLNCVRPVLTSADEMFSSQGVVRDGASRKVILCPPDKLSSRDRESLDRYVREGESLGIHERYVPAHRSPWWKPQLLPPAPILATYMARQAPFFALNPDGMYILNVIHGLYPLAPLDQEQLSLLAQTLNDMRETYRGLGRVYQGGLEKFEPREMERLTINLAEPTRLAMLCDA
jgi:methylase of polypeptide subunit release factors